MNLRTSSSLIVALLYPFVALGQTAPSSALWTAQWIAPEGVDGVNRWIAYRTAFEVGAGGARPSFRVACDSKYWLWVDGELVVFEGQLKRGPDRESTYYDEFAIPQKLRAGRHTLAVLVWHFGKHGMSHKSSGRAGLLLELSGDGVEVRSGASWRARVHPAYYTTGDPQPNWRLPESNVAFDARRDLAGWTDPGYDDSAWPRAVELGAPPAAPWGPLVKRPIPLWRESGLRDYENATELPAVSSGEPIVCRLPYNAQVTPSLEIDAPAGLTIGVQTDNYRGGSENSVRAEYITRDGPQSYESLGWMNGHDVRYTIPAGVKIVALRYRESGYDTDLAGRFECSDERLNTLWRKAQRTLYLEMRDGYFDCPDRERAQWWGDITLELQQAFYALDRRSDALAAKAMVELASWQKPDGGLFSPIPSPAVVWDKELPTQMLAAVGRQGFWEYYRHTGDRATIERVYPAVKRYLDLWEVGDDGLVVPRAGGWTWGDWGDDKDMPLLFNGWYALALDGRARMAALLGVPAQAERDRAALERLKAAYHRAFATERGFRSPQNEGPTDDRGNALAVVAGLAKPQDRASLLRVFAEERHASPYMEKYVLEALLQLGEVDAALDRMLDRFGPMIDSPITTLWEGWGVGPAGYGGGSYNHAWSGGPLTLLSQYVVGVDPLEPAYARVAITPRLGRLEFAGATVPSPRGVIEVDASKTADGSLRVEVQVPEGVTAVVTLPSGETAEVGAGRHVIGP